MDRSSNQLVVHGKIGMFKENFQKKIVSKSFKNSNCTERTEEYQRKSYDSPLVQIFY